MEKILVDTNMFLSQFEFRLDLPSELLRIARGPVTLIVPSGAIDEMRTLSGRTGKRAVAARFALQHFDSLQGKFKLQIEKSEGKVDDWIIKYAQKNKICVATNDAHLRQRLFALDVKTIVIKSKSKLEYI
ncbi:MAG: hypothetical protein NT051_00215 [Candidatus Micrarchaeota archaeon]|nr:hypothetical protein [Candidatus Micrarchaeota archaeon]